MKNSFFVPTDDDLRALDDRLRALEEQHSSLKEQHSSLKEQRSTYENLLSRLYKVVEHEKERSRVLASLLEAEKEKNANLQMQIAALRNEAK